MATRALLIGHVSGAHAAVERIGELHPGVAIDLLVYGRAPDDAPLPDVARIIDLPAMRPGSAVRFVAGLWRTHYDLAVVAQPRLDVSRARGALLGAAFASGAARIEALDLATGEPAGVGRATAVADAVGFVVAQVAARALAVIAAPFIERAARRGAAPPAPTPATGGDVIYLRTDLELALAPVTAGGSLAHTEGILLALGRRGHDVTMWSTGELAGMPDAVRAT